MRWDVPQKTRRLILGLFRSFSLEAKNDLRNVKLYFWANVEGTHPLIQEIFGPLMGQYGKYIEIKKFDASAEIKKVCSHYESEKSTGELNLGKTFGSRNLRYNLLWAVWGTTSVAAAKAFMFLEAVFDIWSKGLQNWWKSTSRKASWLPSLTWCVLSFCITMEVHGWTVMYCWCKTWLQCWKRTEQSWCMQTLSIRQLCCAKWETVKGTMEGHKAAQI